MQAFTKAAAQNVEFFGGLGALRVSSTQFASVLNA